MNAEAGLVVCHCWEGCTLFLFFTWFYIFYTLFLLAIKSWNLFERKLCSFVCKFLIDLLVLLVSCIIA